MASRNGFIKRDAFKGTTFTSSKKYFCNEGELILTPKDLTIVCKDQWSLSLPLHKCRFEASGQSLEVYDIYYGRLRFRLAVNEPETWEKAIQSIEFERMKRAFSRADDEATLERDLRRLLTLNPDAMRNLLKHVQKERNEYERRNIRFNLEIYEKSRKVKDRKLKAFMLAHIYVAWYEWMKSLLYKIHKAKLGKGPKDDSELLKFLEDYPSVKRYMDTSDWGMNSNQIRNCVAHERFFFDYRTGELVFMREKEKRVRVFDLNSEIFGMMYSYFSLLEYLRSGKALK